MGKRGFGGNCGLQMHVRHARIHEPIMGKYSDAEFMTYCNRSQDIALNFPVVCHKYSSSYYQVEGSKQGWEHAQQAEDV